MALPPRVYFALHETSARWGCNIADIAGWPIVIRLEKDPRQQASEFGHARLSASGPRADRRRTPTPIHKPSYPHIHALLFIPKDVMDLFTHADIEKFIEDAIGEIIEVKQKTNSVKCRKYVPEKPIVEVATYMNKAAYFADQWNIDGYQAIVLPRDFTIGRIYGTKNELWLLNRTLSTTCSLSIPT